jgi:hypothetical protein
VSDDAVRLLCQPDGHWRWAVVTGAHGEPVAESPAVFRDVVSCHQALNDVRRGLHAMRPALPGSTGHLAVPGGISGHGSVRADRECRSLAGWGAVG